LFKYIRALILTLWKVNYSR